MLLIIDKANALSELRYSNEKVIYLLKDYEKNTSYFNTKKTIQLVMLFQMFLGHQLTKLTNTKNIFDFTNVKLWIQTLEE